MESVDIRALTAEIERRSHLIESLRTGMHQAIVGQSHLIDSLLIGLLSGGHILLEGLPGLAKTLAIKTLSQLISADYKRILSSLTSSSRTKSTVPQLRCRAPCLRLCRSIR